MYNYAGTGCSEGVIGFSSIGTDACVYIGNNQYEQATCDGDNTIVETCADVNCTSSCTSKSYTGSTCSGSVAVASCSSTVTTPGYTVTYQYASSDCSGLIGIADGEYTDGCTSFGCSPNFFGGGEGEPFFQSTSTACLPTNSLPSSMPGYLIVYSYDSNNCTGQVSEFEILLNDYCGAGVYYGCENNEAFIYSCDNYTCGASCEVEYNQTIGVCYESSLVTECSTASPTTASMTTAVATSASTGTSGGSVSTAGTTASGESVGIALESSAVSIAVAIFLLSFKSML